MSHHYGRPSGILSGGLATLAFALAAQQPEPLRLSVTTRVVEISVVVEGKRGRPVDDLTKDDFVILDAGKPEAIVSFVRSAGERPVPARQPAATPAGSDRDDLAGMPRTVTALVFDGLNTHLKDQAYMKDQMLRFLHRLRPGDSAAIYALGEDLRVLHDFTSDRESLIRALEQQNSKLLAEWSREMVGGVVRGQLTKDRAAFTLSALGAVSGHLSRIPGRKNLVWVTTGFPMTITETQGRTILYSHDNGPLMAATAKAIADAGVALYPVSALGLIGAPERTASQPSEQSYGGMAGAGRNSTAMGPQVSGSQQAAQLNATLVSMAEQTGGRAFTENNDLAGALEQSLHDLTATYTMSIRPGHGRWNGEYHILRVETRRKGLKLRHRPGYVASPDRPAESPGADKVSGDPLATPLDSSRV